MTAVDACVYRDGRPMRISASGIHFLFESSIAVCHPRPRPRLMGFVRALRASGSYSSNLQVATEESRPRPIIHQ